MKRLFKRQPRFTAQQLLAAFDLGTELGVNKERLRIALGLKGIGSTGDYFETTWDALHNLVFLAEENKKTP